MATEAATGRNKPEFMEATGAIFAKQRTTVALYPEDIKIVGIDCPDSRAPGLADPRINDPIREDMVRSIEADGVKVNVEIVADGEDTFCADGRQRLRHARIANERRVAAGLPRMRVTAEVVRVKDFNSPTTQAALWKRARSANAHRLDDSPIRKAANALVGMEKWKYTLEECAEMEGCKPETLRTWLTLLRLAEPLQDAVERKVLSPTAAAGLVGLPASAQCEYLARVEAGEAKGTVAEVHQERAERKAKREKGEDYTAPITAREIKRMVDLCTSGAPPIEIDPAAFRTLKALAGLASPHGVRGLTALFRAIGRNVGTEGGE